MPSLDISVGNASSDSGFATGNYQGGGSNGGGSTQVPEPGTLAGLGLVAAALVGARRRQSV
ncbi:MAG: PEP-CTERM sorting domain-containing protein [Microcoleaceae cyanobacterium]